MGATESKLAFRKNVLQLYEVREIPFSNTEFWNAFIELPESAEDVFNLFSPKDLRKVRDIAPENMYTLLSTVANRLINFVAASSRPDATSIRNTLNCIRILTRILPYVFEGDNTEFEDLLFWTPSELETADTRIIQAEPLGSRLIKAVVALLFYKGFTLPAIISDTEGVHYVIWHKGVGASNSPSTSSIIDSARAETLRLFLTMMSRSIYIPPTSVIKFNNKWITVVTTSGELEKKAVLTLLCSLMNTALHYDPVGWGLVPYNHVLFTDSQEQLVTLCLHVLIVLLEYSAPTSTAPKRGSLTIAKGMEDEAQKVEETSPATLKVSEAVTKETPGPLSPMGSDDSFTMKDSNTPGNAFRYFLAKLYRAQDFVVVIDGVARILKNPMDSASTYLPGSTKRVTIHVEVLMFFWKFIEINEKFCQYALDSDKILVILSAIIYFALESRNDPSAVGLARMCCFILHNLSQERSFGIQLNTPFDSSSAILTRHLPIFTSGTYADFLFLSVHHFITTTSSKYSPLVALHESFLIALANVSPYVKSLTVVTANKMLGMWSVFVNGAWVCANEGNHKSIFYLLETFNNLVQYQMTGNAPLIYAIVRNKEKFYDLRDLTFQSAQQEIARLRALKSQRAAATSGNNDAEIDSSAADTPTSSSAVVDNDQVSEKKKGKMPEGEKLREEGKLAHTPVYDSKGKFVPTEEWFNYWKSHVPLQAMLTLCDNLAPQVEQLCMEKGLNDDKKVLEYLQSGTLVGLLPVPHPLYVRRFYFNEPVRIWLASFLWGLVFLKSTGSGNPEITRLYPPIWTGTKAKLFQVKMG